MTDSLLEIFMLEQKRLADNARAEGRDRDYVVHTAQATRLRELDQEQKMEAARARMDTSYDLGLPEEVPYWKQKRDSLGEMLSKVHVHSYGVLLCNPLFMQGESGVKSVPFAEKRTTPKLIAAYHNTDYYREEMTRLCPLCLQQNTALTTLKL